MQPAAFCVRVQVASCSYCMQLGESLHTIAKEWGTSWLNLWAGNEGLVKPDQNQLFRALTLGPLYHALPHESVGSVALRTGTTAAQLLAWNPDLALLFAGAGANSSRPLAVDQQICVLPSPCAL